ncbi:MAG: M24 family metallopeptidase [Candidatus Thermoplasmatota archaeon]|nr:M24 family metallopeptidase [Candidatus Thermoplasmatota archaeon]
MKNGASSTSFDTIAAFGPDAAEPHFSGGSRKLKKGDVVLVDFLQQFILLFPGGKYLHV